jgi:hypothetical protein
MNESEFKRLLEKNTADDLIIRDLLVKKESLEETIKILLQSDDKDI